VGSTPTSGTMPTPVSLRGSIVRPGRHTFFRHEMPKLNVAGSIPRLPLQTQTASQRSRATQLDAENVIFRLSRQLVSAGGASG
jgi:hypothetical protein